MAAQDSVCTLLETTAAQLHLIDSWLVTRKDESLEPILLKLNDLVKCFDQLMTLCREKGSSPDTPRVPLSLLRFVSAQPPRERGAKAPPTNPDVFLQQLLLAVAERRERLAAQTATLQVVRRSLQQHASADT